MRLTIPKSDLSRLITGVGKVVEARNTIAILSNVLLTATTDTLTIRGTDLDIEATASVPCAATPGSICVDAKLFASIVAKASGDISLSLEADKLIVKSGRSRFSLQTLPSEDFPSFGDSKFDATFDIDLAALFAPVAFAIAVNDNRHMLEGIYFIGTPAETIAVATNGHRLSRHVGPSVGEFKGVIIGQKTVCLVPKGNITVSVSENKVQFVGADITIVSKLIDETYPEYQRVIPTMNEIIVSADRSEMLKAADRVSTVANERGNGVKISVAAGGITFTVRGDVGEAIDEVATDYTGDPTEIGFNSIYFKEALQVMPEGQVTLKLRDSMSPAVLIGGAPGLDITLMPLRI
jgi:DNA polymerase-3 subunit beta